MCPGGRSASSVEDLVGVVVAGERERGVQGVGPAVADRFGGCSLGVDRGLERGQAVRERLVGVALGRADDHHAPVVVSA